MSRGNVKLKGLPLAWHVPGTLTNPPNMFCALERPIAKLVHCVRIASVLCAQCVGTACGADTLRVMPTQ